MTPDECYRAIQQEHEFLQERVRRGETNASALHGLLKSSAQDAARHCGQPERWREFMPPEMRNE